MTKNTEITTNQQIESYIADIIRTSGDDPTREGMAKTPKRAREALAFLTKGYHEDLDKISNYILCANITYSLLLGGVMLLICQIKKY